MLLDHLDNGRAKSILSSPFHTLLYVRDNYQGAHTGLEPVMRVVSTALVFNKVVGLRLLAEFSDVVIIGADPCQQGICTDQRCSSFGKVSHHDGMVVGSRRLERHLFKNWVV